MNTLCELCFLLFFFVSGHYLDDNEDDNPSNESRLAAFYPLDDII